MNRLHQLGEIRFEAWGASVGRRARGTGRVSWRCPRRLPCSRRASSSPTHSHGPAPSRPCSARAGATQRRCRPPPADREGCTTPAATRGPPPQACGDDGPSAAASRENSDHGPECLRLPRELRPRDPERLRRLPRRMLPRSSPTRIVTRTVVVVPVTHTTTTPAPQPTHTETAVAPTATHATTTASHATTTASHATTTASHATTTAARAKTSRNSRDHDRRARCLRRNPTQAPKSRSSTSGSGTQEIGSGSGSGTQSIGG